jgi:hypothetical protein
VSAVEALRKRLIETGSKNVYTYMDIKVLTKRTQIDADTGMKVHERHLWWMGYGEYAGSDSCSLCPSRDEHSPMYIR